MPGCLQKALGDRDGFTGGALAAEAGTMLPAKMTGAVHAAPLATVRREICVRVVSVIDVP